MLTVARCRELLGVSRLSDTEIRNLLDEMHAVARVICEAYGNGAEQYRAAIRELPPSERDGIEERAAILEFESKLPRRVAERLAIAQFSTPKPPH